MAMAMVELGTGCLAGALLGLRHALEPDHLAAVSTLLPGERGLRRGALVGASWGVGHSLALLAVASVLTLLRARLPPLLGDLFELAVAVMLVGLGAASLRRAYLDGRRGAARPHAHGDSRHVHAGPSAHVHLGSLTLSRRPLLVGFVHGLAGSGALTALVLSTLPSPLSRLAGVCLFGLGSTLGMALLSAAAAWPLSRLVRGRRTGPLLAGAAGCCSALVGLWWGLPLAARLLP